MLTEIPAQPHASDPRIRRYKIADDVRGAVRAVVVDEEYLSDDGAVSGRCREWFCQRRDLGKQRREGPFALVHRYDDRDGMRPLNRFRSVDSHGQIISEEETPTDALRSEGAPRSRILARSRSMADTSNSTPGADETGRADAPANPPSTAGHEYADRLNALQGKKWKKWLNVQAPYRANLRRYKLGRTLDIGCGNGRNLGALP